MRAGRARWAVQALLLGLPTLACGPQPATIQPWMLGWKSTVNNPGVPVEMPGGIVLRVDEDGTGVSYRMVEVSDPTYPITIEPRSADEFWVYGVYDDLENPLLHDINPDTAWRIRRLRDACGPFEWRPIAIDTGEPPPNGGSAEMWPGKVCLESHDGPECNPPGGPYKCYRYEWCPDEPPPPQACQERWIEEDTLHPNRFGGY